MDLHPDMTFFIHCFAGLISVMDPIGAIPILLSVTADRPARETRRIVRTTIVASGAALLLFALAGNAVLDFFGISMPAFQASGGILILLMAISMMHGQPGRAKHTPEEEAEAAEKENVAVVPLAIPLLVGPGTMSTVVLLSDRADTLELNAVLFVAMLAAVLVTALCLLSSGMMRRAMGESGIRIASRVMGLVLAAMAVQFIADGALGLFPGLATPRS